MRTYPRDTKSCYILHNFNHFYRSIDRAPFIFNDEEALLNRNPDKLNVPPSTDI